MRNRSYLHNPLDDENWQDDYSRKYTSSQTGRSVYQPIGWRESPKGKESEIACLLADNNYDVVMWTDTADSYVKNPDAYLIGTTGIEIWEFEKLTLEALNPAGAVKNRLRSGKKQAENVLLYIDRDDVDLNDVRRGIRTAIFNDNAEELQQIGVIFRDGSLIVKSREEWSND